MLLSVIVPAYNEEEYLQQTLEQIKVAFQKNQERRVSWELVVCDNNSSDSTAEIASAAGAKVVFEPINQISRARNRGAESAIGDWFLFVDADSYPKPALITEILDIIDGGNHTGCGTTVLVEGGTLLNKLRMERLNPLFRLFQVSGAACLLCEAEAFRLIGGFSCDLYAYEEIDFVLRLKRHGRKNGKKFTVLVHHPVITSGRKGEYNIRTLTRMYVSNFMAVILFCLHYVLPRNLTRKLGSKTLGYWYDERR